MNYPVRNQFKETIDERIERTRRLVSFDCFVGRISSPVDQAV